jgi:hypothetical protein
MGGINFASPPSGYFAETLASFTVGPHSTRRSSAADLSQGGKAFGQGPAIEKGLLERAEKKIAIQQNPMPAKPSFYPFCAGFALESLATWR